METRPRIVIAGAGPVGLVAAHALAQLGYQPVIYEKRLRPSISSSHDAPGYDSIATLGPRPWGSRERTRGVALHGSVIDAIRQLSKIDLVEYPGLHQVRRLISNIDGEFTSAEFPGQSGWWRAENSPFTGASNDRHSLTAADVLPVQATIVIR